MNYGTYICDGCDIIVNRAHIIPFKIPSAPREFIFAFCAKCDRMDVHQRVLTEAAKAWTSKHKTL
jgi:hypothetical protein